MHEPEIPLSGERALIRGEVNPLDPWSTGRQFRQHPGPHLLPVGAGIDDDDLLRRPALRGVRPQRPHQAVFTVQGRHDQRPRQRPHLSSLYTPSGRAVTQIVGGVQMLRVRQAHRRVTDARDGQRVAARRAALSNQISFVNAVAGFSVAGMWESVTPRRRPFFRRGDARGGGDGKPSPREDVRPRVGMGDGELRRRLNGASG